MNNAIIENRVKAGTSVADKKKWYKTELDRVNRAIEDAERQHAYLIEKKIMTRENAQKANELLIAINIGSRYRDKIKANCE